MSLPFVAVSVQQVDSGVVSADCEPSTVSAARQRTDMPMVSFSPVPLVCRQIPFFDRDGITNVKLFVVG
jgi:hypothetical protein